jgi:hypothetical protein
LFSVWLSLVLLLLQVWDGTVNMIGKLCMPNFHLLAPSRPKAGVCVQGQISAKRGIGM